MVGCPVNNELKRLWKEAAMVRLFGEYSAIFLEGLRETKGNRLICIPV
jgi:hypothetical protein